MAENNTTKIRDNNNELMYVKQGNCFTGFKSSLLIDDIPSFLKSFVVCANCEGVMRDPCGVGNPQIFVCSSCTKGDVGYPLSPDRNVASELRAKCPLEKRGCEWQGLLAEIEGHLGDCEYYLVECINGCGCVLQRRAIGGHFKTECSTRQICCEFCNKLFSFGDENLHQSVCLEAAVVCPLACDVWLRRKEITQHTEELCCNTKVGCPYTHQGCCVNVEVKRKDVQSHCNEFQIKHLEMKMEYVLEENSYLRTKSKFQEDIINSLIFFISDPAPVYYFICQSSYDSSHCWTLNGLSLIGSEWVFGPTFKYQSHSFRLQYKLEKSYIILGLDATLQNANIQSIKFCTFVMYNGLKKMASHYEYTAEYYEEYKRHSGVMNFLHSTKQVLKHIASIPISQLNEKAVNHKDSVDLELFYK